jgi:hypothetical protein
VTKRVTILLRRTNATSGQGKQIVKCPENMTKIRRHNRGHDFHNINLLPPEADNGARTFS